MRGSESFLQRVLPPSPPRRGAWGEAKKSCRISAAARLQSLSAPLTKEVLQSQRDDKAHNGPDTGKNNGFKYIAGMDIVKYYDDDTAHSSRPGVARKIEFSHTSVFFHGNGRLAYGG
jgi:hypothetical protein